jgi:two-component system, chemotaxis family, chemotaxis protein CheY
MPSSKPCVLDVGNCDPDHGSIRRLLSRFDVDVDRVMFVSEAVAALERRSYDLVLVNRLIFADSSDALPLITKMKADDRFREIPVMMISNFEEAQDRAVAAGALRGFGKSSLNDEATVALLRPHLAPLTA